MDSSLISKLLFCLLFSWVTSEIKEEVETVKFTAAINSAIKEMCSGNWTQWSRFVPVSTLTNGYSQSELKCLHLTQEYCEDMYGHEVSVNFPTQMTTYMSANKKYLFLYITISDHIVQNGTKFAINFSGKILREMKSKFLYAVWLTENKSLDTTAEYSYDIINRMAGETESTQYISYLKKNELNSRQTLFYDKWLDTHTKDLNFTTQVMARLKNTLVENPEVSINSSYIIFCARKLDDTGRYSMSGCWTLLSFWGDVVYCYCGPEEREYVSYVIAIFWLVSAILIIFPMIFESLASGVERDLFIFSACNYKNALFQYKIILRLGKATKNFNMRSSHIDIQFFNSDKDSLGPELRIHSSLLKSRYLNDITIQMYRLTKIPEIDKISCGHNGTENSAVFMYGLSVETVKYHGTEEPIDYQYIVQKFIFREKRFVNTLNKESIKEELISGLSEITTTMITTTQLTYYQLVWIAFVVYTIFGAICFVIQYNLNAYDSTKAVLTITATFAIGGTIGGILIHILKYLNRSDHIQIILMNSNRSGAWCGKICFYAFTAILAITLQHTMFMQGQKLDLIQSLFWFSVTFFCCCIFTSICIVIWEIQRIAEPEDEESIKEQMHENIVRNPSTVSKSMSSSKV